MKWSVDSIFLAQHWTFNVVWQWRRWAKSNWLSLSLLLSVYPPAPPATSQPPPRMLFFIQHPCPPPHHDSLRTQTACLATYPPPLPSWPERRARLMWMYSRREPTRPVDFFFSARNPTEASAPSHDEPTALPLLHSQEIAVRDYLLWGEPHLFFKWPYLSQIKETLGENWGGTVFCFFFSFWLLKPFCGRHRRTCRYESAIFFVTEDTGHLLFSAFSWWSLYYVKGFCALKMLPLLCQCQFLGFFSFFLFFFIVWYTGPLYLQPWVDFLGVKLVWVNQMLV